MVFEQPKVEFVHIEVSDITTVSCNNNYTCDDKVYADVDMCSCYNSESENVTPFDE